MAKIMAKIAPKRFDDMGTLPNWMAKIFENGKNVAKIFEGWQKSWPKQKKEDELNSAKKKSR